MKMKVPSRIFTPLSAAFCLFFLIQSALAQELFSQADYEKAQIAGWSGDP
jgi:hypothetical protein